MARPHDSSCCSTSSGELLNRWSRSHGLSRVAYSWRLFGLPPLFVAIGSTEVLREDCRRMIKKARQSGVKVHYEEWHRMVHVFPLFSAVLPEGRLLFEHIGRFVSTLDTLQDECVA